jgi:transposase
MWTPTTRQQHSRPLTRYQTDLTDAEWRVIAPHLPKPCATGRLTRVAHARDRQRDILRDGAGCPWRLLPKDLPRWGTIYRWFAAWRDDGRFERMNHALMMADRERVGRDATPRRRSSTAKASRPPRPAARPVTMLARRTGASTMRSSTRTGVASCSNRIRRASRIATAADRFCGLRAASSRSSSGSSPIAGMPVRRSPKPR